MPISADWQFEIRSTTFGAGTASLWVTDTQGLVDGVTVRSSDVLALGRAGAIGNVDDADVRSIDIEFMVRSGTATACLQAFDDVVEAFRPSSSETTLDIRYPGAPETTVRFYGRPRGVRAGSVGESARGLLRGGVARFEALDPLRYGAGTVSTTNAGNAPTDRATITITGTGGTPSITNTSDASGAIVWNTTLAAAGTRVVDLRAKTVVDGGGTDFRSEISNNSTWFRFQPGANSLTVSGCTQSTSLRPAWY